MKKGQPMNRIYAILVPFLLTGVALILDIPSNK
jgi:hypothetical protein